MEANHRFDGIRHGRRWFLSYTSLPNYCKVFSLVDPATLAEWYQFGSYTDTQFRYCRRNSTSVCIRFLDISRNISSVGNLDSCPQAKRSAFLSMRITFVICAAMYRTSLIDVYTAIDAEILQQARVLQNLQIIGVTYYFEQETTLAPSAKQSGVSIRLC